jgi:two-component system alkaline phosphatase synthesis response regulator PhoP
MIFCVEDDKSIRELIVYTLKQTGFEAQSFEKGTDLFTGLNTLEPDKRLELILLDIMLPGEDGIAILKKIRSATFLSGKFRKIPVIMLTAKGEEYNKVMGLESGADDYITKPFGMAELIARIKAAIRRSEINHDMDSQKHTASNESYHVGALTLDVRTHTVCIEGLPVGLTLKEFQLLHILLKNRDVVLTRDKLLEQIWGGAFYSETRTVDAHIRSLRRKLGTVGDCIETVRGLGYRIVSGNSGIGIV